jgi:hypothetical protein
MVETKIINSLRIGAKYSLTKQITKPELEFFLKTFWSFNNIKAEEIYNNYIVQNEILLHMISLTLLNQVFGNDFIPKEQHYNLLHKTELEDVIIIELEVVNIEKIENSDLITIKIVAINQDGMIVLDGYNKIIPKKNIKS